MSQVNLVLTLPSGSLIATSLGIEGLARHLSPGSGKYFHSRSLFIDVAFAGTRAGFSFLNEGGWRDASGDTESAIKAVLSGKRTKTALSNNAFSAIPISGYQRCYLMKTGGQVLAMEPLEKVADLKGTDCQEGMTPAEIAQACGQPEPAQRTPRYYAILAPLTIMVLSNLTPAEYAWYATRRPGKICRQVCFTEIDTEQEQLAAHSRYEDAFRELRENPAKKTKTIASEDVINEVAFESWVGFEKGVSGGLYFGTKSELHVARFPSSIPYSWEKAE